MRRLLVLAIAAALVLPAHPASAYQRPGRTTLISVRPDGEAGTGPTEHFGRRGDARVAMTPDGATIAFDTRLTDLVPDDINGAYDVFVRDTATGTIERVSVPSGGGQANAHSYWPAISADGRFVAFESEASNLVPDDTNGVVDVFIHDRQTDTTRRVSVGPAGEQAAEESEAPAISGDGRFVSFSSDAVFFTGDENLCQEVYVKDLETGALRHVTMTPSGGFSDGVCTYGLTSDISADGRFVAFETQMHDLVPGDLNASWDIFVRDLASGATERVSVGGDEREANYVSYGPSISADGRFVSFYSCASNLVPDDGNSAGTKVGGVLGSNTCFDVFVRDRAAGTTERVSVSSAGLEAGYGSTWTDISATGRFVAFQSEATNLVPGATEFLQRVYVHDRTTRQTDLVSVTSTGEAMPAASWASAPAVSPDGRYVAFNTGIQVWRRDRGPALGVGGLTVAAGGSTLSASGWAGLAGVPVATASDPADDAADPGAEVGGELTGADLVYRPEERDLLVRFRLAGLPGLRTPLPGSNYLLPGMGGAPGVLHTMAFTVNGVKWQVRAIRLNVEEPAAPPAPLLGLWKCDPTCRETNHLKGGYGSTGDEILASVPMTALLPAKEGATVTDISARSALGDALSDGLVELDQVQLGASATIPVTEVRLGIAPAGAGPEAATFDSVVTPSVGSFQRGMSIATLPSGPHELWAVACVGAVCGPPAGAPFAR